jgi:8-oxo-dGTP pyrophosphatase MutT (NUDIX family)
MTTKRAKSLPRPRAYVVVWFRDESDAIQFVAARETAVFERALPRVWSSSNRAAARAILRSADSDPLLDAEGKNAALKIGRNLSGILMIGRAALSGGALDSRESPHSAALRELAEECRIDARRDDLVPLPALPAHPELTFFALDLTARRDWLREHVRSFVPTSDKRSLSIVSPAVFLQLLAAPDDDDRAFIRREMARVSRVLCDALSADSDAPLDSDAVARFADELYHFQVSRQLPTNVAVVEAFIKSHQQD